MICRTDPIPCLLDFIQEWVPDLSSEHRIDASLIPDFVPPPLRAVYEIAGNWPIPYTKQWRKPDWGRGLFAKQDRLVPVDQLEVQGDRVAFLDENQGVWSCQTLTHGQDPPVYSDSLEAYGLGSDGVQEICPSLAHFLTSFCLQELAFGSRFLFGVEPESKRPHDLVRASLATLWENGIYVMKEPTHSFYVCNRQVIVMKTFESWWLAYNDESAEELLNFDATDFHRIH